MSKNPNVTPLAKQTANGDAIRDFPLGDGSTVVGLGSFHKTLRHNEFGEVVKEDFDALMLAQTSHDFSAVPPPPGTVASLVNPLAGLATDRLTDAPHSYAMPPAPDVLSDTAAAEMTELYWMALLRDVSFDSFSTNADVAAAAQDVEAAFQRALSLDGSDPALLRVGIDVPGVPGVAAKPLITPRNLFRLGLPGEDVGPMLSQFFVRPVHFGTQTIDVRQRPYKAGADYLTHFDAWLAAQNTGRDAHQQDYGHANEDGPGYYEADPRYICTMRDLARFVNKDALHQAYFNAALLLLSGEAKWTPGNPYAANDRRDTGFGVLGGPHILALVSEVATRALKIVWYQKWQVHIRLRPEAYGGLAHVQQVGNLALDKRAYGLPAWLFSTEAATRLRAKHGGYLLPLAFGPGSPTHPAYGAGHATVAGACVTVLKAYFAMFEKDPKTGRDVLIPLSRLLESDLPYGMKPAMRAYITRLKDSVGDRVELGRLETSQLTIEGELNKLAQNVAMGRSMGGVHWRTDNARSLSLGEAIAARILCDITLDARESPSFVFRTFARAATGQPKSVVIKGGKIFVDGIEKVGTLSEL